MVISVSLGQFRKNMAEYLDKAQSGNTIILEDEKKKTVVAQLIGKKDFDPNAFIKALRNAAGVFTVKNHPEWKTKKDVIKWLEKERSSFDRDF